ncbi:GNAT family N-acetyltransferase [Undibacterium sp. Xuan67W]|uniref:GNAT family N-acetyltransferase n=1 Tax=Undibacterium sp. Xuan67W TaxID=3413057 RepID=UPI003BF276B2
MSKSSNCSSKKRLASKLPIVGNVVEQLYNPHSTILHALALPNTPLARAAIGDERIIKEEPNLVICISNYFIRYLIPQSDAISPNEHDESQFKGNDDFAVSVLALRVTQQNMHVIDNVYVDEAYRRQGLATRLIQRAYEDFPDLFLDGRFTSTGLLFFGAKHRKK